MVLPAVSAARLAGSWNVPLVVPEPYACVPFSFGVPLSLSLLVRDKAQIRHYFLAINEHCTLVVQGTVRILDG